MWFSLEPGSSPWWAWVPGLALAWWGQRSPSLLFETSVLPLLAWILSAWDLPQPELLFLPLFVFLLIQAAWPLGPAGSWAAWPVLLLCLGWGTMRAGRQPDLVSLVMLGCSAVTCLAFYLDARSRKNLTPPATVDLLLCSYSGNTAHYAGAFQAGVESAGARVRLHRLHYLDDPDPVLTADAVALAFPAIGWKPPWPVMAYLWRRLPRGRGRPAFILYSSAGGPENAGFMAWLPLVLKGYRVNGRVWGTYPVNIPTFRLGLSSWWKWLDALVPVRSDLEAARQAGADWIQGSPAGWPTLCWPTPLALAGLLLDNPWLDRVLCRNWVRRRRCTRCGQCIAHCPTGRLYWSQGYPRARGTCALCFLCVNNCPAKAMQLAGLTEYGQVYRPKVAPPRRAHLS